MPVLLVCGKPCAGRSSYVHLFIEILQSQFNCDNLEIFGLSALPPVHPFLINLHQSKILSKTPSSAPSLPIKRIVILNEQSLGQKRISIYKNSSSEKSYLSTIRASIHRYCRHDTLVIVDTPGGIRGFRYEVFCVARELVTPFALLYCQETDQIAFQRNVNKLKIVEYRYHRSLNEDLEPPKDLLENPCLRYPYVDAYPESAFKDITNRYEPPHAENWWDTPRFVVGSLTRPKESPISLPHLSESHSSTGSKSPDPLSTNNVVDVHVEKAKDIIPVYKTHKFDRYGQISHKSLASAASKPQQHQLHTQFSCDPLLPFDSIIDQLLHGKPAPINLPSQPYLRAQPEYIQKLDSIINRIFQQINDTPMNVNNLKFCLVPDGSDICKSSKKVITLPIAQIRDSRRQTLLKDQFSRLLEMNLFLANSPTGSNTAEQFLNFLAGFHKYEDGDS